MGSIKERSQRVFLLFMALLFLGSTVAISIAVFWQDDAQQNIANQTNNQGDTQVLQGTKLADFTPKDMVEKLEIIDLQPGTGDEVKPGATVTAHYTGAVVKTGVIFQSSHDFGDPATFPLDQVIAGWTQGVPGMKVGGKRRLIIPAVLAYGEAPPPGSGIPPNADLVFDIELVSVQ